MDGVRATLELADWRRRIGDLYAEVRRTAAADPRAAWDLWRTTREALFREHAQSPVPLERRSGFRAAHFDYDPRWRVEARLAPDPEARDPHADDEPSPATPLALPVSAGGTMSFSRIGWVDLPSPAGSARLAVYWLAGYAGGLFLPFRDGTNGDETYGAGRYLLDAAKAADLGGEPRSGMLILDFNFAYHPSCAFDARWACPLAPPENRLAFRVEAGERLS